MRAMHTYFFECVVEARYLPEHSAPQDERYAFAYTVTIVNRGRVSAQLIARHWVIVDGRGHTEEVKGLGVVGQQPLLKPGPQVAVVQMPVSHRQAAHAQTH